MSQHYSNPARENDPHALPDLEVFYVTAHEVSERNESERNAGEPPYYDGAGWYYWTCLPGCLPDSDPCGPFETEELALADAREGVEDDA